MRSPVPTLLPLLTAAALAFGATDAKALLIRYDFDPTSESTSGYTGGTIDVGSLDQTLGTSPVTFTVEDNGNTYTVVADYGSSGSNKIDYFTFSPSNSWEASNFNFGAVTASTKWRDLLGTFTGTSGGYGSFTWATPSVGGNMLASPPASITLTAQGAAVPGPLPVFGAAAAFGWSRRLRKRIPPQGAPLS